jgi:hypothetical protein
VEVIHQIFTTVEGKSIGVSAVNGMLVPLVHFPRNVLLSITLEFIGNPFEFRCEFGFTQLGRGKRFVMMTPKTQLLISTVAISE